MAGSSVWLLLASVGTLASLVGTLFAALRARRRSGVVLSPEDLHITVMKPMSGLDPRLEENLESFARLQAPREFEVLLCLASQSDAAYGLARQFETQHPHRFRIHVGAVSSLGNAKVAQLASAFPRVKNPFIWVSESNVETSQAFLESLASAWKEVNAAGRVKTLVHTPLVGVGGHGLGAAFERMNLSSLQNPNHELALAIGMHAVIGKTEFFHRDDLLALGGFEAFGNYLGEDHMLGLAFAKAGAVRCAKEATRNVLGPLALKTWFDRHSRWAVMRKTLVGPLFYLVEPIIYLAVPFWLWAAGLIPGVLLAALTAGRVFVDGANYRIASGEFPRFTDLALVPLKEALLFAAWVQAIFTFHVKWRADKAIRLGANSLVVSKSANPSKLARHAESLRRVIGSL